MDEKIGGIILAGGSGKRMGSVLPKQYIKIGGKPLLYYSLKAMEDSAIDVIVLVVAKGEVEYCKTEIIDKFGFEKVKYIVEGGKERYLSVKEGLKILSDISYVLIHDGARPFLSNELIERIIEQVKIKKCCISAVPSIDTVRIVDEDGAIVDTPNRNNVWNIQTPQAFDFNMIKEAYKKLDLILERVNTLSNNNDNILNMSIENENLKKRLSNITDDAMVIEVTTQKKIYIVEGDYVNLKVTTVEDIEVAERYLDVKVK